MGVTLEPEPVLGLRISSAATRTRPGNGHDRDIGKIGLDATGTGKTGKGTTFQSCRPRIVSRRGLRRWGTLLHQNLTGITRQSRRLFKYILRS